MTPNRGFQNGHLRLRLPVLPEQRVVGQGHVAYVVPSSAS